MLETARAIKIHVGLPKKFWGECILAATHVINLLPSVVIGWKTPFERLMKRRPDYSHLRVIGCLCYATNSHTKGDKFAPKARTCMLIGYPTGQKAYRVYDLESHRVFVCRDVVFKEGIFPIKEGSKEDSVQTSLPTAVNPLNQGGFNQGEEEEILMNQEGNAEPQNDLIPHEETV